VSTNVKKFYQFYPVNQEFLNSSFSAITQLDCGVALTIMSAPAPPPVVTGPNTWITLKVLYENQPRRFKLQLRDLGPNTLETKIQDNLKIPAGTAWTLERYSDSQTKYVLLDTNNVSVYKQLYRAAKAKLKLKLRVNVNDKPEAESSDSSPDDEIIQGTQGSTRPMPASAEDDAETEGNNNSLQAQPSEAEEVRRPVSAYILYANEQRDKLRESNPGIRLGHVGRILSANWKALTQDEQAIYVTRAVSERKKYEEAKAAAAAAAGAAKAPSSTNPTASHKEAEQTEQKQPHFPADEPVRDLQEALDRLQNRLQFPGAMEVLKTQQTNIHKNLDILESSVQALSQNVSGQATLNRLPPWPNHQPSRNLFGDSSAQGQTSNQIPFPPMGFTSVRQAHPAYPAISHGYAVCCNVCDRTIRGAHYHCSTCDDGDFDLCLDCVDRGETCREDNHWLIKRQIVNGVFVNSTTDKLPRKPQAPFIPDTNIHKLFCDSMRTCNCCLRELEDSEFVHCVDCEDFDLCKLCFKDDKHGHHPKHAFVPAAKGTSFPKEIAERLAPGRGKAHNAYCDSCNKRINGVRHKCLDCPDWDYCNDCYVNANFIHPGHRFAPVYEHIEPAVAVNARAASRPVHIGVQCDGPLCTGPFGGFIRGVRYKCAVCHDTDFCENCEACPSNLHNKTHPLIKFKTPVRSANVTTTGSHGNGRQMPMMGDRVFSRCGRVAPEPKPAPTPGAQPEIKLDTGKTERDGSQDVEQLIKKTDVLTVADVKPLSDATNTQAPSTSTLELEGTVPTVDASKLKAVYVRDLVADGTVMPPNNLFVQRWTLLNEGSVAWPAGCCVTLDNRAGNGDYMGVVDPTRPASVGELNAASKSSSTNAPVLPGQEMDFFITLRTPFRQGKHVSYWRLTTPDGKHFGNRLWCDITVEVPSAPHHVPHQTESEVKKEDKDDVVDLQAHPEAKGEDEKTKSESVNETGVTKTEDNEDEEDQALDTHKSQMIFPKLEKESPVASVHQENAAETNETANTEAPPAYEDEYEDCDEEEEEWTVEEEDDSNGFLTDEEYDVLNASDEE
jgi:next-to-BRCA1 protein 1